MGGETASMNTLVTGGGGFLGGAIVRRLRARGDRVTVLGRGDYPELAELGVRVLKGDVRDRATLAKAVEGADVVFHVAAKTGIVGDFREFWTVNVEGTRHVVEACRSTGVRHLVHTSSPSVVFGRHALSGVDESESYPPRFLAAYPESKAAAEHLVLSANGHGLLTTALRPHLIWGPGDPHLIPRVIHRARAGRLVQIGEGQNLVDITYVDNAADAHVLAADELVGRGCCAGRAYFISQGRPVRLWLWINDLLKRLGIAEVRRRLPFGLAHLVGHVMETAYRLSGRSDEPLMTRFLASQLARDHYFSVDAARRDFGYNPRVSTEEGMDRLVKSLQAGSKEG